MESRGVGVAQGDDASTEASPRHPGTEDPVLSQEVRHQLVHGGHRDLVVAGQTAMAFRHHRAEAHEVAPAHQALGLPHAGALGHDVSGPTAQHGIRQLAQVAEGAPSQRTAEDPGRSFALGPPRRVGGRGEDPRDLAVHDDEGGVGRHRDVPGPERLEVDVQGMALAGSSDRQRVEQAHVRAGRTLRLLALDGEGKQSGARASRGPGGSRAPRGSRGPDRAWPTARRKATEKAALEESPAPTGRVLVTEIVPPEGGGCSRRRQAARRASGGKGAVAAPENGFEESSGNSSGISTCRAGSSSESRPIRKLPGCGLNEISVAMPTAMGSESPPL